MARRKKRHEHDNHERWLISYADFVTLLFAFFVVMYSISSVNETKYKNFSNSLSVAFTNHPSSMELSAGTTSEQEQLLKALVDKRTARLAEQQRKVQERLDNMATGLTDVMSPLIDQHLVSIHSGKRGVVIDVSASLLFKTGEAELQPASVDVLRQVSEALGQEEWAIEVEGHTDDVPIVTPQYPSNWELSSARASSVVRMMVKNGVSEERFSVVGMASTQPIVPNDSPDNRAKNRRVSITIVSPNADRASAHDGGQF